MEVFNVINCNGCPFLQEDQADFKFWCGHPHVVNGADDQAPLIPDFKWSVDPKFAKTPIPDFCPLKSSDIVVKLKSAL